MLFKLNIKRTNNQLNYSTFVTKRVYKDNVISTIVDSSVVTLRKGVYKDNAIYYCCPLNIFYNEQ